MNEEDDENQSWHMFTSEKMIHGYKSAKSAPKERKLSNPSFNLDRPFIEDSPMSPSSSEEYCSAQSFLVDSDTDSEDDDVNMISNNKSKNRRRSQHVVPEESESGRENHISPSDEVAVVLVGSSSNTTPDWDIIVERKKPPDRDIIVEANKDVFQRVSYIHPKLMALQYPLLFPLGEDGYHDKIPKQSANLPNLKDSDMISMKTYYSYRFQIRDNEAMTPRLGGRLFQQLKLEQLMTDIKKKGYFGKCIRVMYVVEFQKRGLPHVHILIWLDSSSKKLPLYTSFSQKVFCTHYF
ncbi:hypothetical protein POM88_021005 [Heracleum sosnowskyi]|uniref:Helitron helicase-like domain-containing protein n=1 Tax=Heracleum sosnowskyi TaxID=360622 RepID=A0AAD8ICU5_9APIA|nr:hypothetical protein POM88_021005 [Heracleum sosnowskyi]